MKVMSDICKTSGVVSENNIFRILITSKCVVEKEASHDAIMSKYFDRLFSTQ